MNLQEYIENSFIGPLIQNEQITDISYNGEAIFYLDNIYGRKQFIEIEDKIIESFLKQIANYTDIQFDLTHPIMDVSFYNYRLNATHSSISNRVGKRVYTFALRIMSKELRIKNDGEFYSKNIHELLSFLVNNNKSIIIGGLTSSGKTELQKYLISMLNNNERLLFIDTINELSFNYGNNIDYTTFVYDENDEAMIAKLLKLSLRYNPDYLIIAEARGSEFEYVFSSALSGISTITTIHSRSCVQIIDRAINMISMKNNKISYETAKNEIMDHFDILIYVKKSRLSDGSIKRYISEIYCIEERKLFNLYSSDGTSTRIFEMPVKIGACYENWKNKNQ